MMSGRSRALKIVGGFAIIGFFLPLILLAYYEISGTSAGQGFAVVCPVCMASMALDQESTAFAIVAWLMFCVINAALYALPGALSAFLLNLGQSD